MRFIAVVLAGAAASLAHAAERVVTLSPHLAELVCAAGACEALVGVVAYSDYPERVRSLPQVGDAFALNAEQILALRPHLVLAWAGGTPRATRDRLTGLGLRLEDVETRKLEDVAAALRHVGRLLGTSAVAEGAARAYERRLARLRRQHERAAPLRVLYQIESDPPYTINRDSPITQAMEICGGRNVFADLPAIAAPVSREAVLARDPEVVVFARQDDVDAIRALWARSPPFTASRVGNLYTVDGNLLDRATPRLLDGVEQLCAVLERARAKLRS